MPLAQGFITEQQREAIEERLVENGPYDNVGETLEHLVSYTLYNKYGIDL